MKISQLALGSFLYLASTCNAFTPTFIQTPYYQLQHQLSHNKKPLTSLYVGSLTKNSSTSLNMAGFLGQDEADDDITPSGSGEYVQTMSDDERKENLEVMKQIFKFDLADLQRRRDYAGWVEAKKDLKQRKANDPWFELNDRMKEAVQLDETEEIELLKKLIEKVGGPPPGVTHTREYAVISEIYNTEMSLSRAESINSIERRKKNSEVWKQMIQQRIENEKREDEEYWNNPYKEEEDAKKRREKSLDKIYGQIEERRKKAAEKAAEIQAKYKKQSGEDMSAMSPLDRALAEARKAVNKKAEERAQRKKALEGGSDETDGVESSTEAESASSSSNDGGRPRMPGDLDVTRGEIEVDIPDNSDVTTDNVRVQVTSGYNASQSDPPMRKHCFQYTIKITNLSPTDTIQLHGRRFEIQTVGARQKDIVQGQGVTGRQPILKPGETFEYTSTAPLSVRPIGTTIIAARMRGTYSYTVVDPNIPEDEREMLDAELGVFQFVFPEDQRVKPVVSQEDDEDSDDEDEEDDVAPSYSTMKSASPSEPAKTASSAMNPPTTLPGDEDMESGNISISPLKDESETVTEGVRVALTSQYREERSDARQQKHCFAYNIRITNERPDQKPIQLVSRRFEIQTIGAKKKDVVQGPGVTGRQPILQPGESFEYTSTAPLSVKPMPQTSVVARMSGEYSFVILGEDGKSPISSAPLKAVLGMFHFILPQVA